MELDQEGRQFVEDCHRENEKMAAVTEKETIPDEAAFQAEIVVKNMQVNAVGDCLLYASALNLLNAYVKVSRENEETVGYWFKDSAEVLLEYAVDHPEDGMIRAEVEKDGELNLCLFEINTIQVSFHSVILNEKTRTLVSENLDEPVLAWDGIRRQKCAMTMFRFAMENGYGRTYLMQDGTDFREGMDASVASFREGNLTLTDAKHILFGEPPEIEKQAVSEYRALLDRLESGVKQSDLTDFGWDFTGGITKSHYECAAEILEQVRSHEYALTWIDERRFPGDSSYRSYFEKQLAGDGTGYYLLCADQSGPKALGNPESEVWILDGVLPQSSELRNGRAFLLFQDSLLLTGEEKERMEQLKETAALRELPFRYYRPQAALGYADLGGGHNFLTQTLEAGDVEYQTWFPRIYRIEVVKYKEQLAPETGETALVIPKRFRYLYLEGRMAKEEADWSELYRILSCGKTGTVIHCESEALGMYLSDMVERWKACFDGIRSENSKPSGETP